MARARSERSPAHVISAVSTRTNNGGHTLITGRSGRSACNVMHYPFSSPTLSKRFRVSAPFMVLLPMVGISEGRSCGEFRTG